jgi:hypothetical protein
LNDPDIAATAIVNILLLKSLAKIHGSLFSQRSGNIHFSQKALSQPERPAGEPKRA